ncbi:MAG: hypothetical protein HYT98_02105 [Candidatus Sungbacteria bacterium]|nr:hypothetical protein [Candidatus Sungbacteria bacterium]
MNINNNNDEIRKRLIAYGILGQILQEGRQQDEKFALYALGNMVETGKNQWVEFAREEGKSPAEVDSGILHFLGQLAEDDEFYLNPLFIMSLRIALINLHARYGVGHALDHVHERLRAIFPKMLAQEIYEYFRDLLRREAESNQELYPDEEAVEKFQNERRKFMEACINSPEYYKKSLKKNNEARINMRPAGTSTEIIPCPACHQEKRVDAATKRFHCKKCGFDRPYPFGT